MWLYFAIFAIELINSCIAALRTIFLSQRRDNLAAIADTLSESLNYTVGWIVFTDTKDLTLGIAGAIASGIGTKFARKIKIPKSIDIYLKRKWYLYIKKRDPVNV